MPVMFAIPPMQPPDIPPSNDRIILWDDERHVDSRLDGAYDNLSMPPSRAFIICRIGPLNEREARILHKPIKKWWPTQWSEEIDAQIDAEIRQRIMDDLLKEKILEQIEKNKEPPCPSFAHRFEMYEDLTDEEIELASASCEFLGIEVNPPFSDAEIEWIIENSSGG